MDNFCGQAHEQTQICLDGHFATDSILYIERPGIVDTRGKEETLDIHLLAAIAPSGSCLGLTRLQRTHFLIIPLIRPLAERGQYFLRIADSTDSACSMYSCSLWIISLVM